MPAPDYVAATRRARQLQSEAFWRIMGRLGRALSRALFGGRRAWRAARGAPRRPSRAPVRRRGSPSS